MPYRVSEINLMNLDIFERGEDHAMFAHLRDHDPLHWNDEPDGPGFWSVTRYEDVRTVALDFKTFSSASGTQIADGRAEGAGDASIHNLDPPEHTRLRRLANPQFHPARTRSLEADVVQVTDRLLDEVIDAGEVDFVARISAMLPMVIIGRLLGASIEDCEQLITWTNQIASSDPEYAAGPETAAVARDQLFAHFRQLEAQRRTRPAHDLVSVLARAEVGGEPLRRGQLDAYYLLLAVAGNETTRNLLTGMVWEMSRESSEWNRIRSDPEAIGGVVEEALRYVSPVLSMRRTATKDVELHGLMIRRGDKVVMWFNSANRDDRVFTDPERFIGNRAPNDHIAFGAGRHVCLGASLARAEARIFLQRILDRNLTIEVLGQPDRLRSNFFRGIKRLPVRITERARER